VDLYNSRAIDKILSSISEDGLALTKSLASAPSADLGNYLRRVGEIRGLERAITIIEQVRADFGGAESKLPPVTILRQNYEG
jgi:hypothetical protein